VFVADDHPVYREGITRAIKACGGLDLVGEAADGIAALEKTRRLSPDVAVLDLHMPGCDGLAVVRALTAEGSTTRAMILSAATDDDAIYDLILAGAAAFLSKDATRADICTAIKAVARGETVFGRHAQGGLANAIRSRAAVSAVRLTSREQEVLTFVAAGLSAPSIAQRMHLSPATVKTHLGTLYQKLGVSDRAAAVAVAMRLGLLR